MINKVDPAHLVNTTLPAEGVKGGNKCFNDRKTIHFFQAKGHEKYITGRSEQQ